jgi:uncharacterized protein YbaP (TraB family)
MKNSGLNYHQTRPTHVVKRMGHLLVALCVLVLAVPLAAQQTNSAPAKLHSLWKVEGKRSTVYLLGSVHVLKAENYPLPTVIENAYSNAVIVAFETDIAELESFASQAKLLAQSMLPEGETLAGQLSPAVYASLSNHLTAAGLPALVFDRLKPGMAAMMLDTLELQKLGLDPQYGLDMHFNALARKQGKEIAALETVDFQFSLVTDFSKEEGELLVKSTLEENDQIKNEIAGLLKAWETGDSASLEKILNEETQKAPAIYKRLLTDRNRRWAPKIEEWLGGDKNAIVIVGAGHLVGKEGVVELLRAKGLKVTQQ